MHSVILAGENISKMLIFSAIGIEAERCALLVLLRRTSESVTECIPACTSWVSSHGSEQGKKGKRKRKRKRKKEEGKGGRERKEGRKEEGRRKERKRSAGTELLLYQMPVIIPPTKALPSYTSTEITHLGELLRTLLLPTWQNSADNISTT